jgi:DNA-binding transcriptional MocR family regulator
MKRATYSAKGATLKRRSPSFLPPIELHRESPEPLHRQIARQFREASLPARAPLPSTRALAASLGVSRNTAVAAYDQLASEGLLESRRGSGSRWRRSALPPVTPTGLLRGSNYPFQPIALRDPDGNPLYLHR